MTKPAMSDDICDICGQPITDDQEYERGIGFLHHINRRSCVRPATKPTLMDAHEAIIAAVQWSGDERWETPMMLFESDARAIVASVASTEAELERLRAEHKALSWAVEQDDIALQARNEEIERQDARYVALRARVADVLRPFAQPIGYIYQPDSMKLAIGANKYDQRLAITLGDHRAAVALLKELEP
jgi:hypothetical protein